MPDPSPLSPNAAADPAMPTHGVLAYAGVLVGVGVGIVVLVALVGGRGPRPTIFLIAPVVLATLVGAAGCAAGWLRRDARATAAVVGVASLGGLAGAICSIVAGAWLRGLAMPALVTGPLFERGLPAGALLGAVVGVAMTQLARMRRVELAFAGRAAAAEATRLRLEKDSALSELKLLRAQIEPHFLYNTLANLRYLVRTDPALAGTMLEHLIRYFKGVLPSLRHDEAALSEELDLCEAYVDIVRMRSGAALSLDVNAAPDIEGACVPPGMLLTLVENAVKHGAPVDASAPLIRIDGSRVGDALVVSVSDNGPGPAATAARSGAVGLANIRERLALQYGLQAVLELRPLQPSGCEARLELPYRETSA